jgi:FlaA1/EpsC-like NDP-sugar epimerase
MKARYFMCVVEVGPYTVVTDLAMFRWLIGVDHSSSFIVKSNRISQEEELSVLLRLDVY